ncbi:ATP-binding protein [Actinoplanes sp. NPDC024001]|uniref:ATP-binding protein n=1 Tax=Actinoplanes sp. NPDC024001 TaxID=3154598 RepID=UPI0033C3E1ED
MADNSYLIGDTPQLTVRNDVDASVTELTVRGSWDTDLRHATIRALCGCLAEMPRTMIVDLADLADPHGDSAPTWQTARQYARSHCAETTLMVCAEGNAAEARRSAPQPPWTHYRRLDLRAELSSAGLARVVTRDACQAWGRPALANHAVFIMSELVTNAVLHTGTKMVASVSVRGRRLHLAVRDGTGTPPRLVRANGTPLSRGTGLRLVRAASHAWGALPCRDGKVVWATVDGGAG